MEESGLVLSPFHLLVFLQGMRADASFQRWPGPPLIPFIVIHLQRNRLTVAWGLVGTLEESKRLRSRLTTSSNVVWSVVSECDGPRCAVVWNRWWSRRSRRLAACSMWEGVRHKQGSQLAGTGTDGAGKWGTSQKYWNLLQRPSPHFSPSPQRTLGFSLLLFHPHH